MSAATLTVRNLNKRFGATVALEDVSLEFHSGAVHALMGENGAGKSTLMKILAGAVMPDAAEISLDGKKFKPQDPHHARSHGVSMVYQELSLAPHLTVVQNIMLGVEQTAFGILKEEKHAALAEAALKELGHADLKTDVKVKNLSSGQKQLVEIARALVLGSKVIIFDEPTTSLSQEDCKALFKVISNLKEKGKIIIYISHHIEEIFEICDNYSVLRDGCHVQSGKISEIKSDQILALMAGREISNDSIRNRNNGTEVLLDVRDIKLGNKNPISFEVKRGEVLGIAGLLGSGRSRLLREIFGLSHVSSFRSATFKGVKLTFVPGQSWDLGMGFLSEDRALEGLAVKMSINDNIHLVERGEQSLFSLRNQSKENKITADLIEKSRIKANSGNTPMQQLSGGNQQKVALARIFNADSDLIILDEPTRGIDVRSKQEIYSFIDSFVNQGEKSGAVIVISSYLPELLSVCDKIAVMTAKGLGAFKDTDNLNEQKIIEEAFAA